MHLIEITTDKKLMTARRPMGAGITEAAAAEVTTMEVWGSSYNDPGDDFCEFRLKRADGTVIQIITVPGY